MKLIKGKREYKLPKYRQIVCVAIEIPPLRKGQGVFNYSLAPMLASEFARLNPENKSNPVYYAAGTDGELFVWPTPLYGGNLQVTLAVERVV